VCLTDSFIFCSLLSDFTFFFKKNNLCLAEAAVYSYTPLYDDELEFKEGEVIEITNTDNPNWYFGRLRGKSGLCPTNYLADDHSSGHRDCALQSPPWRAPPRWEGSLWFWSGTFFLEIFDEFNLSSLLLTDAGVPNRGGAECLKGG